MTITIENLGKRYYRQWIFRHLNCTINPGDKIAITGRNGSGKSTLLTILGGYITPSEGTIQYSGIEQKENIQTEFSIAAPYLNLIEEFTLNEHLDFHRKFKPGTLLNEEICQLSGLEGNENKFIQEFSSGMKQRLRLSLAFFFSSKVILLDEPTSNLDKEGMAWYSNLIDNYLHNRTLIIASNQPEEYHFCVGKIDIARYK